MDISANFSKAYYALLKNKIMVIPGFLIPIIAITLFFGLVMYVGVFDEIQSINALAEELNKKGITPQDEEFRQTLAESGKYNPFWFKELFTLKNLAMTLFAILLVNIAAIYLSCMTFAMIFLAIKDKKISLSESMNATNKFLLRYVGIYAWTFLIILSFVFVFGMLILASWLLFKEIGLLMVLSIASLVIIGILLLLYFTIRLLFAFPIMFLEDKKAFASLKQSYLATKGRFKEPFLVFLVILAVGIAFGIVSNLASAGINLYTIQNAFTFSLEILATMIFYLINSAVSVFSYLFLFYSYLDFGKKRGAK